MKDWRPGDPREWRAVHVEAAILTALAAVIVLGWLSAWLRG